MNTPYTLVVLPGWGHDASMWQSFASRFDAATIRIIELPGFGKEPLVNTGWGVPEYALWTKEKIEALGLTNVVLLGHSFGGRVAGLMASQNPAWVSGLILYGTPLLYRPTKMTRIKIAIAKIVKLFLPGFIRRKFSGNAELAHARSNGLEAIFRRTIPFDLTKALPRIKTPTLLLWGANDTYPRLSIAKEAQTLIAESTLEIVPGAGHNAHLERPELFYSYVKKFLETL